jgi:hypothetical protein
MKNLKSSQFITFLGGILFGTVVLGVISWKSGEITPPLLPVSSKISVQEAQAYFSRYAQSAVPVNQVIKGFAVNKEQLDAMNRLAGENTSLAGFRIYMGLDNNSQPVSVVVGVTNTGNDNSISIYKTASMYSGPCPTICDESSNITTK